MKWAGSDISGAVEQRLVVVLQSDEVDVPVEVGGLVAELVEDAPELDLLALDPVGQEAGQAERLALGVGERRRFVQAGVEQQVHGGRVGQGF